MIFLIIYLLIGAIIGSINAFAILTSPLIAVDHASNIMSIEWYLHVDYETGKKIYAGLMVASMSVAWVLAVVIGVIGWIRCRGERDD